MTTYVFLRDGYPRLAIVCDNPCTSERMAAITEFISPSNADRKYLKGKELLPARL
jgi:hypothetical protein